MVRVLLPPSPEALVATQCGLDAGEGGAPSSEGPLRLPCRAAPVSGTP